MLPNKMTTCPYAALPDYPLPQNTKKTKEKRKKGTKNAS